MSNFFPPFSITRYKMNSKNFYLSQFRLVESLLQGLIFAEFKIEFPKNNIVPL